MLAKTIMAGKQPTVEELADILGSGINASSAYFTSLGVVGYCSRHPGAKDESGMALELTKLVIGNKIERLAAEGERLLQTHPDYQKVFDTILLHLNEKSDFPRREQTKKEALVTVALYHQKLQ